MSNADPMIDQATAAQAAPAPIGRVVSVRGSHADIGLPSASPFDTEDKRVTVGKFVGMRAGKSVLIGVITDVSLRGRAMAGEPDRSAIAHLDIVGEIRDHGTPSARFQRGVASYPAIGDPAGLVGPDELALVFNRCGSK